MSGCSCSIDLGHDGLDAGFDARPPGPRADECGNGLDDDGNGRIDDFCPCAPGETQRCFSGALASNDIGACMGGTQTCMANGSEWGDWGGSDCDGEVLPATETCDGSDADCDGAIDEGCPCTDGATRGCGDEFTLAPCRPGTQSCRGGAWSACEGAVGPMADVCTDAIDNDCDGLTNEGCECAYPPTPEVCRDAVDNDCDGVIDEPECTPDWPGDAGVPMDVGGDASEGFDSGVACAASGCRALARWTGPSIPDTELSVPPSEAVQVSGVAVDPDGGAAIVTPFEGAIDVGCGAVTAIGVSSWLLHRRSIDGTCLWQRVLPGTLEVVGRPLGLMLYIRSLDSGDFVVLYRDRGSYFGASGYVLVRHRGSDGEPIWARPLWDDSRTDQEVVTDVAVDGGRVFIALSLRAAPPVAVLGRPMDGYVTAVARLDGASGAPVWVATAQHNAFATARMGSGYGRLAVTCDGDPILAAYASGVSSDDYGIPERVAEWEAAPVWDFGDGGFRYLDIAPEPGSTWPSVGSALILVRFDGETGALEWRRNELTRGVVFPTPILRADGSVDVSYLANGGTYLGTSTTGTGVRFARYAPDGAPRGDTPAPVVAGRVDYYQILPSPGGYSMSAWSGATDGALHLFRFDESTPFESHVFSIDTAGAGGTVAHRRFYSASCGTVMLAGAAAGTLTIDGASVAVGSLRRFVAQIR